MHERCCLFLGIILCLALVSESGVIVPRALPRDGSSGNGELPLSKNPSEKDKKLGLKPIIRGHPAVDDDFKVYEGDKRVNHPGGPIDDYDYFGPDRGVDDFPRTITERFPSRADPEWPEGKPEENDDTATDDNFKKPFDEENSYRPDNNDKDLESSPDENKPIHKNGDEPEFADTDIEELEGNNKDFKPKEKERPDEEKEENDIPEDGQEKPDEENDKPEDDEEKPEEGKEENEKPENGEEKPEEEENEKPKDDEESEEEEKHEPEDDKEKHDEEREEEEKHKPENDDEKNYIPEEEPIDNGNKDEEMPKEVEEETDHEDDNEDEESVHEAEEAELSSDGSIFDNPFFNLEQVKKYFSTLERALGHVFRETVDEAILLNGTYANTTEEEVEIDGKKYIIMKSVIKGGDNHSSLYVESLSSKPKMNDSKVMEDIIIKNVTRR